MAGKEATVYIVDCGRTMGQHSHGRKESNLDFALHYIWDKITTTISTGRKTLLAGVVGLRTDATDNDLSSEDDYQHISVYQKLGQILMPHVRQLRNDLVVSNTEAGDAVSSLVIAIQMISETCKKLQYLRKIVLVTDARAPMQADDLSQITAKLKEDQIELVVLGVDFDDAEYGVKEENKDATKAENEEILRTLCSDCDGTFGTLAQAVDELQIPRVKSTKPVPSYKGFLTLGNPETYETAMSIGVERYPKTMQQRPPTASKFVVRGDMTQSTQASSATMTNGEGAGGDGLAAVKSTRAYQIEDEEAAGGKREVEPDELSKGYEYGRTAVHISESDRNVTTYETSPCLDIMGFVETAKYARYLEMDRTNLIVPAKGDDKAAMALSSFIHALYEADSYAIARLVAKQDKEPRILMLAPHIDPEFECLYDTELPFAEDVRSYKFPPLDRVVTVSGKILKLHRNLPSDDLQDAMSAYVDSMDLSTFGKDDEGEATEYAPIDETFSPMLHRIHQVTKHRAVYSDAEPPPPYDILTKYSHPPADLIAQSQKSLDAVIAAAQVKKVPPKARGRRFGRKGAGGRDAEKPLSDLDVNALLAQDPSRQKKRIDPKNAIPEFKQILTNSEDVEEVRDACAQLQRILFDWIKHSKGESGYGRAIEAIRVMREETLNLEEPELFNKMLVELKEKLLGGLLGGERREMWWRVRVNRLRPITSAETEASEITEEQAKEMMSARM